MAAKIYNSAQGAFVDAPTPQIYDSSASAYKNSAGLVYDAKSGAWAERWAPQKKIMIFERGKGLLAGFSSTIQEGTCDDHNNILGTSSQSVTNDRIYYTAAGNGRCSCGHNSVVNLTGQLIPQISLSRFCVDLSSSRAGVLSSLRLAIFNSNASPILNTQKIYGHGATNTSSSFSGTIDYAVDMSSALSCETFTIAFWLYCTYANASIDLTINNMWFE